jgi:hypothetical protein
MLDRVSDSQKPPKCHLLSRRRARPEPMQRQTVPLASRRADIAVRAWAIDWRVRAIGSVDITACQGRVTQTNNDVAYGPLGDIVEGYSITSSASICVEVGISMPSALAVLTLMMKSNLDGCSTGISPGFSPRRILSTISATRVNTAGKLGP